MSIYILYRYNKRKRKYLSNEITSFLCYVQLPRYHQDIITNGDYLSHRVIGTSPIDTIFLVRYLIIPRR